MATRDPGKRKFVVTLRIPENGSERGTIDFLKQAIINEVDRRYLSDNRDPYRYLNEVSVSLPADTLKYRKERDAAAAVRKHRKLR